MSRKRHDGAPWTIRSASQRSVEVCFARAKQAPDLRGERGLAERSVGAPAAPGGARPQLAPCAKTSIASLPIGKGRFDAPVSVGHSRVRGPALRETGPFSEQQRPSPAAANRFPKTCREVGSGCHAHFRGVTYSLIPIACTGRARSTRRVGSARARTATSADTPMIATSCPSGT